MMNKFKQDIAAIGFLALGLFLGSALFSFNPLDPSFNSIGNGIQVSNYCGYVGSFVADILFQAFGLSSWLLVLGALRASYLSFIGEGFNFKNAKMVWGILLTFACSALLTVYFPNTKIFQQQIYLGGLIGLGVGVGLEKAFNHVGVQIILWTSISLLAVFYFDKAIHELLKFPKRFFLFALNSLKTNIQKFSAGLNTVNHLKKSIEKSKSKSKDILKEKDNAEKESELKIIDGKKPPVQMQFPKFDLENEEAAYGKTIQLGPKNENESSDVEDNINDDDTDTVITQTNSSDSPQRRKVVMKAKVQRKIENWELPKLSLLDDPPAARFKVDEKEIRKKAELLKDKLSQFSVTGEVTAAKPGPAVTMFEFKPSANVRLSKITELADDMALALSSESLRIIAPIPGRDVVGIETSNSQRETVYLKDLLADENFWKEDLKLPLALGKQVDGQPKIVDLRKMPHLMIAGTTGSGKSVFTVSSITGLLFKHSPKTLRLIMIDPKQVDLAAFDKLPHLIMPIVNETRQAVNALKWAVREMEKRYRSMSRFGARGLEAFNEAVANLNKEQIEEHEKFNQELESTPGKKNEQYYFHQLPYIVICVEEFGDLMTVDKANVETAVVRLAQMARACGIHLILAMQSPRKEVVTGLIKTNSPGRISFKVNSSMDSRIILDETGAERLLAQGDMLYKTPGGSALIRHHGPFLKDTEINLVAKFWSDQAEPEYDLLAMKSLEASGGGSDMGAGFSADFDSDSGQQEYDERYDEILSWASTQKEISASLIQRRFQLGYPRAARIVEQFEREGVVGPANGSKPRQVLVHNLHQLME